jgi:predicted dehydrogenase
MKLRVGLVGLGKTWEKTHRPSLMAMSDRFDVRAVCEPVAHRAQKAATELGAVAVDGFRALVERDDVDAVLILSPHWFGALPIFAACEAGKAVYWAAALDFDRLQAQEIKRHVEESGVAFVAEFPRRLAPATLRLKELMATKLGPPRLLFCHHRMQTGESVGKEIDDSPQTRMTRNLIELVEWCRYVVDREPLCVSGTRHLLTDDGSQADYEMMSLDFSEGAPGSGPVAQISAGRYVLESWPEAVFFRPPAALQVACERGVAFVDLPSTVIWFDEAGRHMESLESDRPVWEQLLIQFHRAVTSLVRNTSDLEDAYRSLSIVQAARCAHREGRRQILRDAADAPFGQNPK